MNCKHPEPNIISSIIINIHQDRLPCLWKSHGNFFSFFLSNILLNKQTNKKSYSFDCLKIFNRKKKKKGIPTMVLLTNITAFPGIQAYHCFLFCIWNWRDSRWNMITFICKLNLLVFFLILEIIWNSSTIERILEKLDLRHISVSLSQ